MTDEQDRLTNYLQTPDDPATDPLLGLDDESSASTPDIFARRELLKVGTVPEFDRIVGRNEEMKDVATELRHLAKGEPPNHVIIYGKTGTGKSLVARHVVNRVINAANARDLRAGNVYVECKSKNTETRTSRTITRTLNTAIAKDDRIDESVNESSIDIPRRGIGADEYYEYLWEILNEHYDGIIVILDEIDKLTDSDDVLHELSRAREAGHTDAYIGIVAISNKIQYNSDLNERVKSSLRPQDFIFEPYSAAELVDILDHRRDAFHSGVLTDSVIPRTADLAAQEHGDARKAIDVLRIAGEVAEKEQCEQVHAHHVENAQTRAEVDRLTELLKAHPPQAKNVLYALAKLTNAQPRETFSTSDIYDRYALVAADIGVTTLSFDRVYQILTESAFLGITESERITGGREGHYLDHRLLRDPDVVLTALLLEEDRLSDLEGEFSPFS
jgi:cell division control protein 6